MTASSKTLHIYGQYAPHDDCFIVGDREALVRLKEAIEKVLLTTSPTKDLLFTSDGEGYNLVIAMTDQELAVPYVDEPYRERRKSPEVAGPYDRPLVLEVLRKQED